MPAKNTKRLSLDLYPDDLARLRRAAEKQKTTFVNVLRNLILQHLKMPTFEEWLHLQGLPFLADRHYNAMQEDDQKLWHTMKREYLGTIARFR